MKNILSIFRSRKILVTFLLGFSSGLPLPLVWGTLKGWLTSDGLDLKTIGLFSLVTYPYSLKFIWAPMVDRFSLPFLQRRTGWILLTQILLIPGIILLGFTDPKMNYQMTFVLAFIVAFLSATQDIAIDAYRAEVLKPEEFAAGAAVATTGARIALLIAGAAAFIFSDHMPWSQVYMIMALLMGVGLVATLIAPSCEESIKAPRTIKAAILEPFKTFFERSRAFEILVFIILFKLGDVLAGEMFTPFLIKTGFSKTEIGALNKGLGMISTILGSLFAGGLVSRLGIWRSLLWFGIIQPIPNLLYALLAHVGLNHSLLVVCVASENFTTGMASTAFVAFLMGLCDKRYTATHYALLSSVMALSRPMVGVATGFLAENLGWVNYFILSALLAIPGMLLLFRLRQQSN